MANSIATAIAGRSTCMQMRWGKARVGGWVPRNVRLPIACLLSEQERGPQGTSPKQQEQQHGDLGRAAAAQAGALIHLERHLHGARGPIRGGANGDDP